MRTDERDHRTAPQRLAQDGNFVGLGLTASENVQSNDNSSYLAPSPPAVRHIRRQFSRDLTTRITPSEPTFHVFKCGDTIELMRAVVDLVAKPVRDAERTIDGLCLFDGDLKARDGEDPVLAP